MPSRPIGIAVLARAGVLVLCATLAASLAGAARAADEPPDPESSAVFQYQELVPTARGPKAPGVGDKTRAPLPPAAKQALAREPGSTGKTLEEVATSSDYGAPQSSSRNPARDDSTLQTALDDPSVRQALSSAAGSATSMDTPRLIGLLALLVAVTGVGIALGARRGRG